MESVDALYISDELKLIPLNISHAQESFDLIQQNRTFLSKWLLWPPKIKILQDQENFIANLQQRKDREYCMGIFKANGSNWEMIGTCSLVDMELTGNDNFVELGYWISEANTGKGIVTKACSRLIKFAFEELKVNKVRIILVDGNLPSMAVAKRLGFNLSDAKIKSNRQSCACYVDMNKARVFVLYAKDWTEECQ